MPLQLPDFIAGLHQARLTRARAALERAAADLHQAEMACDLSRELQLLEQLRAIKHRTPEHFAVIATLVEMLDGAAQFDRPGGNVGGVRVTIHMIHGQGGAT